VLLLLIVLIAGGAAAWMWYGITKPYQGFAAEGVYVDVAARGFEPACCGSAENKRAWCAVLWRLRSNARRPPKRPPRPAIIYFSHCHDGREVFWKLAEGQV